jgi:Peptidase A4 family
VYSRRAFGTSRRRPASRRPGLRLSLTVAGASVPVIIAGYALMSVHSARAVNTASVSYPAAGTVAGAWSGGSGGASGSGSDGDSMLPGHTMMPGPAGSVAQGSVVNAVNAAVTSENWAGYASAGNAGTFTSVSASWSQPAVTCTATDTFSSFWVGLDGDGTNSVEQTGSEADCNGGNAAYSGWFEMFPAAPVFYNNPVQPGDAMSASVTANGGGAFTLTLTDSTQGWTQTTNQTSNTAQLGSAEIIAEAPSSGNGNVLPLSNFGTVNFTNVTADNTAFGNENPDSLTMVSANNVTEATPSALTGGNAFTVTWDSDGAAGPATPAPSATATAPAPSPSPTATAPGTGGGSGHHHYRYWWWGSGN